MSNMRFLAMGLDQVARNARAARRRRVLFVLALGLACFLLGFNAAGWFL